MDRVPGRAGVPLGGHRAIPGDLAVHLRLGWQGRAALKQICHPLRLDLGYRHHRADRLDEPDEVQPGQLRRDDPVVQGDLAVLGADEGFVEERKADLVSGAVDHRVDLLGAAVGEVDAILVEPVNVGPDDDVAVIEPAEQAVRHRRRSAQHLAIRPGQPVFRHRALGDAHQQRHREPLHPERRPRAQAHERQMIGGHAEQVFRHYVGAPPHGKQRPCGDLRALGGGIAGGVADAEDENAFASEWLGRPVMVRMDLLTGESASAGKGRFRILWIPVVTVSDQHGTIPLGAHHPGIPLPDRDVPAAFRRRLGLGHLGPELNPSAETEMIHEVIEVLRDQLMAQVARIVARHRERCVLHAPPG